ncbi:copper chaperone PCu(A)C [Streptomyces sp. 1331.2]|uniref:copper chaperone PCu(A)C n=1 Tax=Streptomyces sp. 1331.2 TaxID=1938835 RepID=UPI000BE28CAB|nr:copper chaperone PCu(A)C [Streptomyces sp. 1331.2]
MTSRSGTSPPGSAGCPTPCRRPATSRWTTPRTSASTSPRSRAPDYQKITIYQTTTESETSKMVKLDKVTLSAKGGFAFTPGEHHLMLEKPTRLIKPGDNAKIVFFLSDGKVFKARIPVRTSPELY